jgi:hypothetical protein
VYTDLRGVAQELPLEFETNVQSIMVRKDCELFTYEEPNFHGKSTDLKQKTVEVKGFIVETGRYEVFY